MATFSNIFGAKTSKTSDEEYVCEKCHYKCSKKYNWTRHILTSKHQSATNSNICQPITSKNEQSANFTCQNCNKEYKDRTGLWRHKQKCSETNIIKLPQNETLDKEIIMMLIKDNSEVKTMMMEQQSLMMQVIKNGTHNTTTNTHTNSHNKAFNLNLFLNETCKDAMNIMDFVDSIKLQLCDLERVGEFGFVDGISNIIIKNLKELDVTERPIHCTDKKREVLYVKDEDKWEKDDEKNKMKKVIKRVANKNIRLLPSFKEKYPDCNKSTSNYSDKYNKIIVESMDTDGENENKIIANISKSVMVQKDVLTI
jgi:hypothetical protein